MIIAENNKFTSLKDLKIINFYSDGCPPCHAFMPNFIAAEETFGKHFDFISINTGKNIELSQHFGIRSTPTIIIINSNVIVFNQAGVPNGAELKKIMNNIIGELEIKNDLKQKNKKKFFGLF